MGDSVAVRRYLPSALSAVQSMAPAIAAASRQYGVSPNAIAGAVALEANNADQFYIKYAFTSIIAADSFAEYMYTSRSIQQLADEASHSSSPNIPNTYQKFLNPTLLDIGPANSDYLQLSH